MLVKKLKWRKTNRFMSGSVTRSLTVSLATLGDPGVTVGVNASSDFDDGVGRVMAGVPSSAETGVNERDRGGEAARITTPPTSG